MNNTIVKNTVLAACMTLAVAGLYACAENKSMAKQHPVEVPGAPACTDCHIEQARSLGEFNHSTDFKMKKHAFAAAQREKICTKCHNTSFCIDCHARNEELKPSDMFKDAPARTLPHRGDYLTQHRIDGKIDPAPCFKCHGRQNNERCKQCHK